ncbi:MAG: hypothetical protein AAGJ31_08625 [Verrucomicrobiota bacterium]
MTPPSLAIDLGAAFTKLAFRPQDDFPTNLLRHNSLNLDAFRMCVPSVAAQDTQSGRWVYGMDAMDLQNRGSIEVYRNWKPCLFAPREENATPKSVRPFAWKEKPGAKQDEASLLRDYSQDQALDVAARYLRWLREEMIPTMLGHHLPDEVETQLCVPDFALQNASESTWTRLMQEAGFHSSDGFLVSEPLSNLVGVLTRGRNLMNDQGLPDVGRLFPDLVETEEDFFFIDVGAYTADFALVRFSSLLHRTPAEGSTGSAPLGLKVLDDLVRQRSSEGVRSALEAMPASGWERLHSTLYGGATLFGQTDSWEVEYGISVEGDIVDACLDEYAQSVVKEAYQFLGKQEGHAIRAAVLTGGGNNLPRFAGRIAEKLFEQGISTFYLGDSVPPPEGVIPFGLSQHLIRGASAVGAASVMFAQHQPQREALAS